MTPSEFNDAWRAQLAQYRRGCRLNAAPAPVQRQDGAGVGQGSVYLPAPLDPPPPETFPGDGLLDLPDDPQSDAVVVHHAWNPTPPAEVGFGSREVVASMKWRVNVRDQDGVFIDRVICHRQFRLGEHVALILPEPPFSIFDEPQDVVIMEHVNGRLREVERTKEVCIALDRPEATKYRKALSIAAGKECP